MVSRLTTLCLRLWKESHLPPPPAGALPAELHRLIAWFATVVKPARCYIIQYVVQNRLEHLSWLIEHFDLLTEDLRKEQALQLACRFGHLPMAQWLIANFGLTVKDVCADEDCWLVSFPSSYTKIPQWLLEVEVFLDDELVSSQLYKGARNNCLYNACCNGHLQLAQWLTDTFDLTVNRTIIASALDNYPSGDFPSDCLYQACSAGHLEVAQWLIDRWFNPGTPTPLDDAVQLNNLLRLACIGGHLAVVRWLSASERRAVADPLCWQFACECGNLELAQWLVSHWELDRLSDVGTTALLAACSREDLTMAQWATDIFQLTTADARSRDNHCLRMACWLSEPDGVSTLVQWLVERFQLTADDARSMSNACLRSACKRGNLPLAKWLVERFQLTVSDARNRDDRNCDCFQLACSDGHLEVARWLIERMQMDASDAKAWDNLAFYHACVGGYLQLAIWLADTFQLTASDARQREGSCLWLACEKGLLEMAQWLAERFQLTVDDVNAHGSHCLHLACINGHLPVVSWLFSRWPPKKATYFTSWEKVCFQGACAAGHLEIARLLAEHSSLLVGEAKQLANSTLPRICIGGHLKVAQWLVSHFELASHRRQGKALQHACQGGYLELAIWLADTFRLTADNAREENNQGFVSACSYGHLEVAQWLVKHFQLTEQDVTAGDNRALRGACKYNQPAVIRWLSTHWPS